jgi:hypothetical protein
MFKYLDSYCSKYNINKKWGILTNLKEWIFIKYDNKNKNFTGGDFPYKVS